MRHEFTPGTRQACHGSHMISTLGHTVSLLAPLWILTAKSAQNTYLCMILFNSLSHEQVKYDSSFCDFSLEGIKRRQFYRNWIQLWANEQVCQTTVSGKSYVYCKFSGFQSNECSQSGLLHCDIMQSWSWVPAGNRNMPPPSSDYRLKQNVLMWIC